MELLLIRITLFINEGMEFESDLLCEQGRMVRTAP
jgi:hypothetical protein